MVFAGQNVVVPQPTAGTFKGFSATCTHQGCSLADGTLDGTTVTCVCHGSQFDVTSGEVLEGPAEYPVRAWPVTLDGDDISIDVE